MGSKPSNATTATCCVVVFAKAPIPGQVKTRLIPAIGAEAAAMLHAALVERALESATRTKHAVELSCAPDADDAFFEECAEEWDCSLSDQGTGDLGERMLRAMEEVLADFDRVAILGADCPAVTPKHINTALAALGEHDVALIPAEDGGYVLIAARRAAAAMFNGVTWGTASVLAEQCHALTAAGLTYTELETLWDVDRPDDLARLHTLSPPLPFFLPPASQPPATDSR
jgi:rSAM/selenodomain-associated transferase 1